VSEMFRRSSLSAATLVLIAVAQAVLR